MNSFIHPATICLGRTGSRFGWGLGLGENRVVWKIYSLVDTSNLIESWFWGYQNLFTFFKNSILSKGSQETKDIYTVDSPYLLNLCFWIKPSIVSYLSLLNLGKAVSQVLKVPGMSWIKEGCISTMGFPGSSAGKESACNVGDPGLTPESRRSTQEAIGYPLRYSGLQNSTNGGAWPATVHGVAKSWTQLSTSTIRNPAKPVDPPTVHLPRGENWVLSQEVSLCHSEALMNGVVYQAKALNQ